MREHRIMYQFFCSHREEASKTVNILETCKLGVPTNIDHMLKQKIGCSRPKKNLLLCLSFLQRGKDLSRTTNIT